MYNLLKPGDLGLFCTEEDDKEIQEGRIVVEHDWFHGLTKVDRLFRWVVALLSFRC